MSTLELVVGGLGVLAGWFVVSKVVGAGRAAGNDPNADAVARQGRDWRRVLRVSRNATLDSANAAYDARMQELIRHRRGIKTAAEAAALDLRQQHLQWAIEAARDELGT